MHSPTTYSRAQYAELDGGRMQELDSAAVDARRWPTYRPRRTVVARRLGESVWLDGRFYRDGYMVRNEAGRIVVVTVAEFEAIYELSDG